MYQFLYIIVSALFFTVSITGLLPENFKFSVKMAIFLYSLLIVKLFAFSYGQIGTLLLLVGAELAILLTSDNKFQNCILSLISYIGSVSLNYILLLFVQSLLGIIVTDFSSSTMIFSWCFLFLVYAILRLARHPLNKFIHDRIKYIHQLLSAIAINLFIGACMMVLNISIAEQMGYTNKILIINCALFFFFFLSSTFLLYMQYREYKKSEELHIQLTEQQILKENIKNLEEFSEQLRTSRHDYMNVLYSIDCFISENDLNGLRSYYKNEILPQNDKIKFHQNNIKDLESISQKEIKSILLVKAQAAFTLHIKFILNIPNNIEFIIKSYDLVRMLGIFLDNSLEAAQPIPNSEINISMYEDTQRQYIEISNTCELDFQNPNCLFQKGFTTKTEHSGLGLYNVRKILEKYPSAILTTTCKNNIFTQALTISSIH